MRILHFFKTYWPDNFGGVERVIHALAKGSTAHGIQSDVLTLSKKPSPDVIPFDGHQIHQVRQDFEIASTGFSRAAFGAFKSMSRQADLIHFHFPWPFMDLVELASHHNKPTLVTYHSDIVKQKRLMVLYQPLMNVFLNRVDRIVATSPDYLQSSPVLQRHADKTVVIPLGLNEQDYPAPDPDRVAFWRARFPRGFFLFVGVLRYYKGIEVLFEATKRTGLPVAVLGGGFLEDDLKRRQGQENATEFHMLGRLDDPDKIALLSLCHAFVFPSHLRSEAFGMALVEAAMMGKPMISCDIGTGTSYVNKHNETGLVIPPNDPDSLASAMRFLWDNPDIASAFGKAARIRYQTLLTADRMVADYAKLYRSMV